MQVVHKGEVVQQHGFKKKSGVHFVGGAKGAWPRPRPCPRGPSPPWVLVESFRGSCHHVEWGLRNNHHPPDGCRRPRGHGQARVPGVHPLRGFTSDRGDCFWRWFRRTPRHGVGGRARTWPRPRPCPWGTSPPWVQVEISWGSCHQLGWGCAATPT